MASYLSNVLTNTTSRYNQLRRTLLSDDSDGDTEDDSHISRALRAYYIEKGRPFPPWLPPDPKARGSQRQQVQQQYSQSNDYYGQPAAAPRRTGALNDLWDSPKERTPAPQPQSLRRGAPAPGRGERFGTSGSASSRLQPTGSRPQPDSRESSGQSYRYQRGSDDAEQRLPASLIPGGGGGGGGAGGGAGGGVGGGSTQDRLKARLWGGQRPSSPGQPPGR